MIEIEVDWKSCVGILSLLKLCKSPFDNFLKLSDNVEDYYVNIINQICSREIGESFFDFF